MDEMNVSFQDLLDKLYDEENNEVILLNNEAGEEIAFEQIALIPQGEAVYLIVKPVVPIEGIGEDEGLVLFINEVQERLDLVTDMEIIDRVFDVYDQLVEEEDC